MLRSAAIPIGLFLVAQAHAAETSAARAPAPSDGRCGSAERFERSGQIGDLPGCEGPLVEVKQALARAERALQEEAADRAASALQHAEEALAALEGDAAGPLYQRALSTLRARAQLLPEGDGLRACHAQAQALLRAPEPPELPVAQAQVVRAEECMALLRRLLAQKPVQEAIDGVSIEVAPGQARHLSDLLGDVRAAHRAALQRRQAALRGWEVVRARWLRVLYGDRLRVFNEHPEQLPEYEGKARGPLPASVLPRWRYQLPDGRVETYLFRRNRLISRTVEDPRRS